MLGLQLRFLPHISEVECPPRSHCGPQAGTPTPLVSLVALTSLDSIYVSLSISHQSVAFLVKRQGVTPCGMVSAWLGRARRQCSRHMCGVREE